MKAILTIEGHKSDVTALIGTALEVGLLRGLEADNAVTHRGEVHPTPPKTRGRPAIPPFAQDDRVYVTEVGGQASKQASYGVKPGWTGTVKEVKGSGKGYIVLVHWDHGGAPARVAAGLLARARI